VKSSSPCSPSCPRLQPARALAHTHTCISTHTHTHKCTQIETGLAKLACFTEHVQPWRCKHTLRSTQSRQNWHILQSTYSLGDANTHSDQHRVGKTGVFHRARTTLVMHILRSTQSQLNWRVLQNTYSLGDAHTQINTELAKLACVTEHVQPW